MGTEQRGPEAAKNGSGGLASESGGCSPAAADQGDARPSDGPWLPNGYTALLGQLALVLAAHFPQWVRRRTTTISFLDDLTVSQRLTVSMRLPSPEWFTRRASSLDLSEGMPSPIYVPLNIVTKGSLAVFRIADADDRTVSMLNRVERCHLAVEGFLGLGELADEDQDLMSLRKSLADIIDARDVARGEEALEALSVMPPLDGQRASANGSGSEEAARSRASHGEGGGDQVPAGGEREPAGGQKEPEKKTGFGRLRLSDPYRVLLETLSGGFLILVPVPYEEEGPREHLFTVTWEETQASNPITPGGFTKTVMASLGLWPKELKLNHYNVGWAESTHFVVEEPPGSHNLRTSVELNDVRQGEEASRAAEAEEAADQAGKAADQAEEAADQAEEAADQAEEGAPEPERQASRGSRRRYVCACRRGTPSANDAEGQSPSYDKPTRYDVWGRSHADIAIHCRQRDARGVERELAFDATATVSISLAPRLSGAFLAVTVAAVASAVLLWILRISLGAINVAAITAVTVVLPAILAAWLIRQGEHAITGVLLTGVRICGFFTLLLVVGATVAIIATDGRAERTSNWQAECSTAPEPALIWRLLLDVASGRDVNLDVLSGRALSCETSVRATVTAPKTQRIAVSIAAWATSVLAGILSLGLALSSWRVLEARRRARDDGKQRAQTAATDTASTRSGAA